MMIFQRIRRILVSLLCLASLLVLSGLLLTGSFEENEDPAGLPGYLELIAGDTLEKGSGNDTDAICHETGLPCLSGASQEKYAERNLRSVTREQSYSMTADLLNYLPKDDSQYLKYLLLEPQETPINTHDFAYISEVPAFCNSSNANVSRVLMVVAVHSAVDHFVFRKKVRETWGNRTVLQRNKAVLLFFLGSAPSEADQELVAEESRAFQDIVQETYTDSYQNLTIKTRAIFKFLSHRCKGLQFDLLLKTDDDILLDLDSTSTYLQYLSSSTLVPPSRTIYCFQLMEDDPPRRNTSSKNWIVPEQYPGRVYPPYCYGNGYFVSRDLIEPMYKMSLTTRHLWLEDVFFTGFVARNLGFVRHVALPKQKIFASGTPPQEVLKAKKWLVHGLSSAEVFDAYWPVFQSRRNLNKRAEFLEAARRKSNVTLVDFDFEVL